MCAHLGGDQPPQLSVADHTFIAHPDVLIADAPLVDADPRSGQKEHQNRCCRLLDHLLPLTDTSAWPLPRVVRMCSGADFDFVQHLQSDHST